MENKDMKRIIILGFLSLFGALGTIVLLHFAFLYIDNVYQWHGSRLWASAQQLGVTAPLTCCLVLMALSIVGLCVEYFRK